MKQLMTESQIRAALRQQVKVVMNNRRDTLLAIMPESVEVNGYNVGIPPHLRTGSQRLTVPVTPTSGQADREAAINWAELHTMAWLKPRVPIAPEPTNAHSNLKRKHYTGPRPV